MDFCEIADVCDVADVYKVTIKMKKPKIPISIIAAVSGGGIFDAAGAPPKLQKPLL